MFCVVAGEKKKARKQKQFLMLEFTVLLTSLSSFLSALN